MNGDKPLTKAVAGRLARVVMLLSSIFLFGSVVC
jgi:hypothetical protein